MLNFLISSAHAQEAAAEATTAAPSPIQQFLPIVVVFIIFYFLMLRPQKKKMEQERKLLDELSKGDEVYTKGGILGTITGMSDKVVTLETTEGVNLKLLKSQVAGLAKSLFSNDNKVSN